MIYTGGDGDGDDKMLGVGRGWGQSGGDGEGMETNHGIWGGDGAAPMGTVWGRGKNSGDGVGIGMKLITVSFSSQFTWPQVDARLLSPVTSVFCFDIF